MTLMANDLSVIVAAVMGKAPRDVVGTIVEGFVPNESCHPQFRLDVVRDDCNGGPDDVLMGAGGPSGPNTSNCEYLFLRFTYLGTKENPLPDDAREEWELWVLTYGPTPDDWMIHIPQRLEVGADGQRRRKSSSYKNLN